MYLYLYGPIGHNRHPGPVVGEGFVLPPSRFLQSGSFLAASGSLLAPFGSLLRDSATSWKLLAAPWGLLIHKSLLNCYYAIQKNTKNPRIDEIAIRQMRFEAK